MESIYTLKGTAVISGSEAGVCWLRLHEKETQFGTEKEKEGRAQLLGQLYRLQIPMPQQLYEDTR